MLGFFKKGSDKQPKNKEASKPKSPSQDKPQKVKPQKSNSPKLGLFGKKPLSEKESMVVVELSPVGNSDIRNLTKELSNLEAYLHLLTSISKINHKLENTVFTIIFYGRTKPQLLKKDVDNFLTEFILNVKFKGRVEYHEIQWVEEVDSKKKRVIKSD